MCSERKMLIAAKCFAFVQLFAGVVLTLIASTDAGPPAVFRLLNCAVTQGDESGNKSRIALTCKDLIHSNSIVPDMKRLNDIGEKKGSFEILQLSIVNSRPENVDYLFDKKELPKIVLGQMTNLTLSGCGLTSLPGGHSLGSLLDRFPYLQSLDLSNNSLTDLGDRVDLSATNLTRIRIDHNPWDCTGDKWLVEAINDYGHMFELPDTTCCGQPAEMKGMSFNQVYWINSSRFCQECHCYAANSYLAVNCSRRHLKSIPQGSLPFSTKIVDLSHNQIDKLNFPSSWDGVLKLYLQNNSIDSLMDLKESKIFASLRTLHLNKNRLTEFPYHIRDLFKNVDELRLGDNPWLCDCQTANFRDWIVNGHGMDADEIKCASDRRENNNRNGVSASPVAIKAEFAGKIISRLSKADLCQSSTGDIAYLDIISITLGAATIFIILKLVYDWQWQRRTGKLPRFFKINI